MKTLINPVSTVLLAMSLLFGCTKKDQNKTTSGHYLLASVSGSSFSSSGDLVKINKNEAYPYPYVEVRGYLASGAYVSVWIYSYTGALGTFMMAPTVCGGFYKPAGIDMISSAHGMLTISTATPNLTGSFSFTCVDSSVISGTFDAPAP
jgi:hypothetical protein